MTKKLILVLAVTAGLAACSNDDKKSNNKAPAGMVGFWQEEPVSQKFGADKSSCSGLTLSMSEDGKTQVDLGIGKVDADGTVRASKDVVVDQPITYEVVGLVNAAGGVVSAVANEELTQMQQVLSLVGGKISQNTILVLDADGQKLKAVKEQTIVIPQAEPQVLKEEQINVKVTEEQVNEMYATAQRCLKENKQ